MRLNLRNYVYYKLLNSLFLGLSVGSIFVIYTPLEPSVYSIGGILLALGMLFLAKFYENLMEIKIFFYITLFVELIVLSFVGFFLYYNYSYITAMSVYAGYQLTFVFGNYLVRMETISLKRSKLLSFVDIAKQKGYLLGLILSYLFYKSLAYFAINDKQIQVYNLYLILFILQIIIIVLILKSFKKI
jgi:putative membrane protein